ncbi:hypothetical protein L486_01770 [Kwoniella mangroviensis CBS 10435]|uniref:C2H2-type domain-containing protein n=1 Tax=Kwoniella mangroviensis CBS 10435 TaxID=1331196 RepID=A0A1B9J363_9TREE|nr:hypothetical protein L486_01770 [Kwoniella mangroviensis CBS 10435]
MSDSTSYQQFYLPPPSSSSHDPLSFSSSQQSKTNNDSQSCSHPGIGTNNGAQIPTNTINLNIEYQDSYPYPYPYQVQYPYNPTSSSFEYQQTIQPQSPPSSFDYSQQTSSSPISASFPVPSEYYQSYPNAQATILNTVPSSSPTQYLPQVGVANFPSQPVSDIGVNTFPSTSAQPLTITKEGQIMDRGYNWPTPIALEGKMQDMQLENQSGGGMWHSTETGPSVVNVANETNLFETINTSTCPSSSSSSYLSPSIPTWETDTSTYKVSTTSTTQPTTPGQAFTPRPSWQSYTSPANYGYRPHPYPPDQQHYRVSSSSPTSPSHKLPTSIPFTTSFSLPTPAPSTPAFVVRPSLEMLTTKVARPKRRLPTPPRISGWVPPEQRPLPSSDMGEEGRPRMLPVVTPEYFSSNHPHPTPNPSSSSTTMMIPSVPRSMFTKVSISECDTCLPQVQSQNQDTFAFAMSNPPDTSITNLTMPTSSHVRAIADPTSTDPLPSSQTQPTLSIAVLSKRDLLTRQPFDPSGSGSGPSRPRTEPYAVRQRGRPRSKAGTAKRPSTGGSTLGMGISRRWRIEQKLASSVGMRRFMCPDCDEPFTRRNDLERHQRSKHTGETPFICPGCEKGFSRKDKLDQHIEKVPACKAIAPPREGEQNLRISESTETEQQQG